MRRYKSLFLHTRDNQIAIAYQIDIFEEEFRICIFVARLFSIERATARRRGRMNEWNERRFDKGEQERMKHIVKKYIP